MNNSIPSEDVSTIYTQILLFMCFVKWETYCISLRNLMCSSATLVLMYIKPTHVIHNGDFSLLRIKSQDVTPW